MIPVPDDNRSDNRLDESDSNPTDGSAGNCADDRDGSAAGTAELLAHEGRRARQLQEQARALVDAAPQLAGEVAAVEGEVAQTYREVAVTAEYQGRDEDAARLRARADHAQRFARAETREAHR